MSKSMIVIDTADRCWDCELKKSCKVISRNQSGSKWNVVHPQCPLQDTTELLEALEVLFNFDNYYIDQLEEAYFKLKQALGGNNE